MSLINMSSKQYTMLKEIKRTKVFSLETAALYLQPTYTSMVRRGYLVTNLDEDGQVFFEVTNLAAQALSQYESEDILRSRESSNLSNWLDNYVKRSQRRHPVPVKKAS